MLRCYRHTGPNGPEEGVPFRILLRANETRRRFDIGAFERGGFGFGATAVSVLVADEKHVRDTDVLRHY